MFMNIILSSVTDKSNRRRWAFLNTLQALDPPTFKSFGLTFLSYETTLSITYLLKNSEISTLFGSSLVLRQFNACGRNVWLAKRLPKL
eukprot:UN21881